MKLSPQQQAAQQPAQQPAARKVTPGLYLVATPIGNLRDITLRALDLLQAADIIACEDSRVTRRLLSAYGIDRPLVTYHDHNAAIMRPKLLARLAEGAVVALCSDAGTPLVSDPGYKLVREVLDAGLAVTALPGASATLTALQLSGLPSDRFLFAGFLAPKSAARRKALQELAGVEATLVFFESAKRLAASLADMAAVLGPRPAGVARELTKFYEEVRRGRLDELAQAYKEAGPPKGEVVVVVGPPEAVEAGSEAEADAAEALDRRLEKALAADSLRDAVALVVAETGLPRRQVYQRALALSGSEKGGAESA